MCSELFILLQGAVTTGLSKASLQSLIQTEGEKKLGLPRPGHHVRQNGVEASSQMGMAESSASAYSVHDRLLGPFLEHCLNRLFVAVQNM